MVCNGQIGQKQVGALADVDILAKVDKMSKLMQQNSLRQMLIVYVHGGTLEWLFKLERIQVITFKVLAVMVLSCIIFLVQFYALR